MSSRKSGCGFHIVTALNLVMVDCNYNIQSNVFHISLSSCRPEHTDKEGCSRCILEAVLWCAQSGERCGEPVSQARWPTLQALPDCLKGPESQQEKNYTGFPWNPSDKHSEHLHRWV